MEDLRILFPPQILVPLPFCTKFERTTASVKPINFEGHKQKSDFDIYHAVAIFVFPQKVSENQYTFGTPQNISFRSNFSNLFVSPEKFEHYCLSRPVSF